MRSFREFLRQLMAEVRIWWLLRQPTTKGWTDPPKPKLSQPKEVLPRELYVDREGIINAPRTFTIMRDRSRQ